MIMGKKYPIQPVWNNSNYSKKNNLLGRIYWHLYSRFVNKEESYAHSCFTWFPNHRLDIQLRLVETESATLFIQWSGRCHRERPIYIYWLVWRFSSRHSKGNRRNLKMQTIWLKRLFTFCGLQIRKRLKKNKQ